MNSIIPFNFHHLPLTKYKKNNYKCISNYLFLWLEHLAWADMVKVSNVIDRAPWFWPYGLYSRVKVREKAPTLPFTHVGNLRKSIRGLSKHMNHLTEYFYMKRQKRLDLIEKNLRQWIWIHHNAGWDVEMIDYTLVWYRNIDS